MYVESNLLLLKGNWLNTKEKHMKKCFQSLQEKLKLNLSKMSSSTNISDEKFDSQSKLNSSVKCDYQQILVIKSLTVNLLKNLLMDQICR